MRLTRSHLSRGEFYQASPASAGARRLLTRNTAVNAQKRSPKRKANARINSEEIRDHSGSAATELLEGGLSLTRV